ncbi:hypothetical protein DFQ28_002983 [Apophysomyces sp. BC1034]|nr:hypothetical protein DFQ29_006162 [Apophysomyces sp. BC1021]KAG0193831.1 hypothetical protein DFQ28_002983 [Apophysomyces sp. BC1034]
MIVHFKDIESTADGYDDAGREAYALCLDVDQKLFRDHGRFFFNGTIETDGYGLSVILQDQRTRAEGVIRRFYLLPEESPYIDEIGEDDFPDPERTMVCDPSRRDLLYMVHETSEPGLPLQLRYTQNQRQVESKLRTQRQRLVHEWTSEPQVIAVQNRLS